MFKYITFSAILVALMALNLLYWQDPFLGLFLTLIYFLYFGRRIGALALPNFNLFWQRLFGPLIMLAGLAVIGATIYYLYALSNWAIIVLLVLCPAGLIPYCHLFKKKIDEWESGHLEAVPLVEPNTRPANRWAWLVLLGDGYLFYYLFSQATTEATRAPWNFVNFKFFLIFFLLTFCLILFINRTESSLLSFFTIFVHSFLLLSVALIIYRLGYGFDPFIHRAAEDYIAKYGFILPKTPYYIGQYVLVVMFAKIIALPLHWIDKIFLPLLEALILPPLVFLTLRHGLDLERRAARLGSVLFFLIPFGWMIATTPQDLANFFALTFILFAALFLTTRLIPWWMPALLALATLMTHPLIGLPIVISCLLLFFLAWRLPTRSALFWQEGAGLLRRFAPRPEKLRQIILIGGLGFITILGILALPAVFLIFQKVAWHWPNLKQILDLLRPTDWPQTRPDQPFSLGFALIYYYNYFLPFLILLTAGWGGWQIYKKQEKASLLPFYLGLTFLILIFNIALLKLAIIFPNVINYEQAEYAHRLSNFSFYLLLPLFLFGLIYLINQIRQRWPSRLSSWGLYALLALFLAVSFYLSYPRVDSYAFSRTFNVSAADIAGTHQIEKKSGGEDYLVLSNQIFSAAALQEFGFKKYYKTSLGPIFYYALPTGDKLYDYYQKMVYQGASRETMNQAMDLTGVKQSYLVINDYWNSFKTAAPQAKQTADEWWEVDGGKILVFRYKR